MAAKLKKRDRQLLEELIQYLNLDEMRTFCRSHGLPQYIHVERPGGELRRTGDRDRKDVVLKRILEYAVHGNRVGPTIYPANVVADGPLPARLDSRIRVRYGQYEKKNPEFVAILQRLTDGAFRTGMIARLVLRDFWTAGKAPTFAQLAKEWLRATEAHTQPRPEGAYLVDLSRGQAGKGWKRVRVRKAGQALKMLDALVAGRGV